MGHLALAIAALAALVGCASAPPPGPEALLPPPAPAPAAPQPAKVAGASRPAVASPATQGFTPLPSREQVLATTPERRLDPFAPLARPRTAAPAAAATGRPGSLAVQPPITLPAGFQFNGVVSVGGVPQALVTYRNESGSLSRGDQGGRTTPLLPIGWSVASIDAQSGHLLLRQGQRTVSARLNPALL
ncbi:hypothetical protein KQ313_09730 [Synechococcus sp. CS-1325]|uniref:hypothetical protein n=1 Tax=unclassified Synechococcus TaxID=2626047 RepID=UPI000DB04C6E|nr:MULTISPECIES: hypothetical protein [unclassified Synechococcus]MCT0199957.1 hypothetical protein [Synechococcus sp. CS-1325]MCT0230443.1 hypothetical protein [Synechococcus sp. CS-1324]PZV03309.1 MAG: hypothetical protein DCF23_09955 [Cyanobium sp.]